MNTITSTPCQCPDCNCLVKEGHHVSKDGKDFCSQACADGHVSGEGCCGDTCKCHG